LYHAGFDLEIYRKGWQSDTGRLSGPYRIHVILRGHLTGLNFITHYVKRVGNNNGSKRLLIRNHYRMNQGTALKKEP